MSSLTKHTVVHWFTTPKELRQIAEDMEQHWTRCMPGESKTVASWCGKDLELKIIIDQDRIDTPGWMGKAKK